MIVIFRMLHVIPRKMHSLLLIFQRWLVIDILNLSLLHLGPNLLIFLNLFYPWWWRDFCWLIFSLWILRKFVLPIFLICWSFGATLGMTTGFSLRMQKWLMSIDFKLLIKFSRRLLIRTGEIDLFLRCILIGCFSVFD